MRPDRPADTGPGDLRLGPHPGPALLSGYRSPLTGASGADNPVLFSGFKILNSETRYGAFTLVPTWSSRSATTG